MESAIGVLVSQFKAYAGSDGSSDTLSREEFHRLVPAELPNFVTVKILGLTKQYCCNAVVFVCLLVEYIPVGGGIYINNYCIQFNVVLARICHKYSGLCCGNVTCYSY